MQRHQFPYTQARIFFILAMLLSACAPSNSPSPAVPGLARPSPTIPSLPTSTPQPSARLTPEFSPAYTDSFEPKLTLSLTPARIGSPLPTNATCSPTEADPYLDIVLPLADEHTLDTYEAQKMEALTDEGHVVALRDKALVRLKSIQEIQAPPCLLAAHEKMTASFELLISTWDLIILKDYSTATEALHKCYQALVEAVALIANIQQR